MQDYSLLSIFPKYVQNLWVWICSAVFIISQTYCMNVWQETLAASQQALDTGQQVQEIKPDSQQALDIKPVSQHELEAKLPSQQELAIKPPSQHAVDDVAPGEEVTGTTEVQKVSDASDESIVMQPTDNQKTDTKPDDNLDNISLPPPSPEI